MEPSPLLTTERAAFAAIKQMLRRSCGLGSEQRDSTNFISADNSRSEASSQTSREAGLVIELDGGHHLDQAEKDNWRTKIIKQHGFRVIRFWDSDVLTSIDDVIEKIVEALRETSP